MAATTLSAIGPMAQLRAGRLGRRIPQLLVGLWIYGLSMAMMIRSHLGLDPWDVFHSGVVAHVSLSFGTVVVIVGASSGIGRETALRFARRGAKLVIAARNDEGLESLHNEILRLGGTATPVVADTTDPAQMKALAGKAVETYGRIDTWAHVAGGSIYPFVHNLLLAARDRDLGGVITTFLAAAEADAAPLLGLPDHHGLVAMVGLGHPVHQPTRLRRRPVEAFTTVDRFDGAPFDPLG